MIAIPKSQPILTFDSSLPQDELRDIRENLSAISFSGAHLWLGGDEGTRIDRMTIGADGNFNQHRRFDLAAIVELPLAGTEIDIEGLDFDGGYLWVIGSHSLKRKKAEKPKDDKPNARKESDDKNRERLAKVEAEGNRYTLARIALKADGEPAKEAGSLRSARLQGDATGDLLFRDLCADDHLARFCNIPSKDNGIDVEGLAVSGNRIFAGLRGPVLRGWAVVLEFECNDSTPGSLALTGSVRKHFLQLEGLGVRELAIHNNDLYILAGPSMDLDGPVYIFRWPKALETSTAQLRWRKDLEKVLTVPFGMGKNAARDHAEGLALIKNGGSSPDAMICYDSPAEGRLDENQVRLDIFELASGDIDR